MDEEQQHVLAAEVHDETGTRLHTWTLDHKPNDDEALTIIATTEPDADNDTTNADNDTTDADNDATPVF